MEKSLENLYTIVAEMQEQITFLQSELKEEVLKRIVLEKIITDNDVTINSNLPHPSENIDNRHLYLQTRASIDDDRKILEDLYTKPKSLKHLLKGETINIVHAKRMINHYKLLDTNGNTYTSDRENASFIESAISLGVAIIINGIYLPIEDKNIIYRVSKIGTLNKRTIYSDPEYLPLEEPTNEESLTLLRDNKQIILETGVFDESNIYVKLLLSGIQLMLQRKQEEAKLLIYIANLENAVSTQNNNSLSILETKLKNCGIHLSLLADQYIQEQEMYDIK